MGHANRYWTASAEASISRAQITAPWATGDHSQTKIEALNFSFHLFYDAKTSILQIRNGTERSSMLRELHNCAQRGWGMGVHDLDDAFEHLLAHNGQWTDNNTGRYYGGESKVFRAANMVLEAPEAAVNFLNAVDELMNDVKSAASRNVDLVNRLAMQRQRQAPWPELKESLESMKTGLERVKYLLWWTPRIQSGVGRGASVLDTIVGLGDSIDRYDRGVRAGMSPGLAASVEGLRQVMRFVPIVDAFYGSIAEGIPDLVNWYNGLIQHRIQQIEAACNAA
jgi:hypothetical protein